MVNLFASLLIIWVTTSDSLRVGKFATTQPRTSTIARKIPSTTAQYLHSNHYHQQYQRPHLQSEDSKSNRHSFALTDGGSLDVSEGNSSSILDWRLIVPIVAIAGFGVAAANHVGGIDFGPLLEQSIAKIESLGPYGYLYFAMVYVIAEVLAVPALPLTASSGYLFGLIPGFVTVLISATIAASISFFIGRTLLREWAQKIASTSSKWRAIDAAIGKEGFKVILLLRMSPLLPFAISNYLYGLTSVDFGSYLAATFLGFAPGTLGIVYAGSAGKALFSSDSISALPWYAYAAGGALLLLFGNTVAKVATDALKQVEEEDKAKEGLRGPTDPK